MMLQHYIGTLVTAGGVSRYIVGVLNATTLYIDTATSITAGTSYTIRYGQFQTTDGFIGSQGGAIGSSAVFAYSPKRINFFGVAVPTGSEGDDGASVNVYSNETQYPLLQFNGFGIGAAEFCFDCQWATPPWVGSSRYISSFASGNVLLEINGAVGFIVSTQTGIAAGSTISSFVNRIVADVSGRIVLAPSASGVRISSNSNQLILGLESGSTSTTITTTPAADRTLTIPDAGQSSAEFVLTAGPLQTITGSKAIQSLDYMSGRGTVTYNTGTITAASGNVAGSGVSWPNAILGGLLTLADGRQRIAMAPTTNSFTVYPALTASAGTAYTLIYGSGLSVTNDGQIAAQSLGLFTQNGSSINMATILPASTYTASVFYTMPDTGGFNADFVLTLGTSTIGGTKHFTSHGYDASTGSSTYNTGTVGTNGASTYIVTGAGTTFTARMIGGILVVNVTNYALIVGVPNGTTLVLATPVAVNAASTYTIYYAGTEMAQGYMSSLGAIYGFSVAGAPATYSTGTVSSSSATVTGVGTTFTGNMAGGVFFAQGAIGSILSVASTTSLTLRQRPTVLTTNAQATISAGASYVIFYTVNTGTPLTTGSVSAHGYDAMSGLVINSSPSTALYVGHVTNNIFGQASDVVNGPHVNWYTDDAIYPSAQFLWYGFFVSPSPLAGIRTQTHPHGEKDGSHVGRYQVNHQNMCLGCYFNAGVWKSSTTTANYRISSGQSAGRLDFDIATGQTVGASIGGFSLVMSLVTGSPSYVNFPGAGGARFQTTGGTASSLNYYEENTGSVTASGALSGTVNYVVIRIGKIVALQFTTVLSGTCSANVITTTAVTTRYRPTTNINQIVLVQNNAATAASLAVLDTSGILTIYGTAAQANFVNGAACTFFPAAMTFPLS